MAYRNETYTISRRTYKLFGACERSDVAPNMANRGVTVDMSIKWGLNSRKRIEFTHG
jgi:hypothetical protein